MAINNYLQIIINFSTNSFNLQYSVKKMLGLDGDCIVCERIPDLWGGLLDQYWAILVRGVFPIP